MIPRWRTPQVTQLRGFSQKSPIVVWDGFVGGVFKKPLHPFELYDLKALGHTEDIVSSSRSPFWCNPTSKGYGCDVVRLAISYIFLDCLKVGQMGRCIEIAPNDPLFGFFPGDYPVGSSLMFG